MNGDGTGERVNGDGTGKGEDDVPVVAGVALVVGPVAGTEKGLAQLGQTLDGVGKIIL